MPKPKFDSNSPYNFKNKTKEEMQEIGRLGALALLEKKKKRKDFLELLDLIGNSTVEVAGVEVSRNMLVMLRLYEKAIAGDVQAAKLLIDLGNKDMADAVIAQIIKLKID